MPNLLMLPDELLEVIASNLAQSDISAFVRTNRRLYLSLNYYLLSAQTKSILRAQHWHGVLDTG